MIGSIAAELLKLRKRPAVWLTGASWLVVNLFFSYLVPYLFYRSPTSGPGGTIQVDRSLLLAPCVGYFTHPRRLNLRGHAARR